MQKIIGYSGHVPCRNDVVGVTAGETFKQSQFNFDATTKTGMNFIKKFASQ
jgi:hypothetical protein